MFKTLHESALEVFGPLLQAHAAAQLGVVGEGQQCLEKSVGAEQRKAGGGQRAGDDVEHRGVYAQQEKAGRETDQDFADLDLQIKAMKGAEAALDAAENGWIAQIDAVGAAKRRKDMLAKLMRDNRLMAEKLLASEKERRRGEIVAGGVKAFADHVAALNTRLGKPYMPTVPADFGGAIKGKKSLSSMEDAVGTELARAKIASNEIADRIQVNLATLREKAADDLAALVTARIAEHNEKERARQEVERERIRNEERQRLEREQADKDRKAAADAKEAQRLADAAKQPAEPAPAAAAPAPATAAAATPAPAVIQMPPRAAAAPATAPSLSLGQELLPGVAVPLPNLRYPKLPTAYHYAKGEKYRGYRWIWDWGTEDDHVDFTDVVLANLHYEINEGGTVTIMGTTQYNGDELQDNDVYGELSGLASEGEIHMKLLAPAELMPVKKDTAPASPTRRPRPTAAKVGTARTLATSSPSSMAAAPRAAEKAPPRAVPKARGTERVDHTVMHIEKVQAAYERAKTMGQDHDTACAAAAQALGIAVESVRDAVALTSTETSS